MCGHKPKKSQQHVCLLPHVGCCDANFKCCCFLKCFCFFVSVFLFYVRAQIVAMFVVFCRWFMLLQPLLLLLVAAACIGCFALLLVLLTCSDKHRKRCQSSVFSDSLGRQHSLLSSQTRFIALSRPLPLPHICATHVGSPSLYFTCSLCRCVVFCLVGC